MGEEAEYRKLSREDERGDYGSDVEDDPLDHTMRVEGRAGTGDQLHRLLDNRHIQLIAIGGSIGTALFVSIGDALHKGGPANLLLAFVIQSLIVACVNNSVAEMTVLYPVSGGFIRMAGKWVDEALGVMAGYNFFLYQALLVPFEITALSLVLSYWSDNIPVAAVCAVSILCYGALNVLAVGAYGEAEFWLSGGKFILICILFCFTLITSLGINPKGDAYGFRYWSQPGAFAEYITEGSLGRFEGFLACLWAASFTIVGPEFISMVAAEARRPRTYLKTAFETVFWRFGIFFIGSAICVGLVIPYNDAQLVAALSTDEDSENAAASPYVIAMMNLGITALPSVVNALLVTSIFSAGNTCTYCATRSLYSLALEGRAPRVLRICTKSGVPIACFAVVICFPCLSFLAVNKGSAQVLNWLISLVTGSGIIDYIIICLTYLRFYYACRAQGVDRSKFPYYGRLQPFCAWVGLVGMTLIGIFYGYTAIRPPNAAEFLFHYGMVIACPLLYGAWKIIKRTNIVPLKDVDLVWERPDIDAYEAGLTGAPSTFIGELIELVKPGKKKKKDVERETLPTDETAVPMLTFQVDKEPE